MISFAQFRLDLDEERLWSSDKLLALRRKPFAILRYLATNPKKLVTHADLLQHVWDGAVVSESAVRTHLHELRQVLGDGVIETVIGRGYRFVAELGATPRIAVDRPPRSRPDRAIVGRDEALAALHRAGERAIAGHRQVCFVTGDPGIGKTTLVDAFLDESEDRGVLAVRGQCVEQYGTPEGYLPVIEMLGQLLRSERGERARASFLRHAPTFLAQMPQWLSEKEHADVVQRSRGSSDSRMLREIVEAIEDASALDPLVIVLEDLQWSDVATIDLLGMLGQRRERAKLFVIATSRRAEVETPAHPLNRVMRPLVARFGAVAIGVERIAHTDVELLLALRYPNHVMPPGLAAVIARITGGTPLFVSTLLDDLVARGMIARVDDRWTLTLPLDQVAAHRPDSVKQLIDIQIDRLALDEQRVLEAGCAVGGEFSVALVAAALELPTDAIEDTCDSLARRHLFLRREASEDLPDGSVTSRYAVTHGLVQDVCVERTAPLKQHRWHRLIAEKLEAAYAGREAEVAGVLAMHFDKAQLPARAVNYYVSAAHQRALRLASADALATYERALALIERVVANPERDGTELHILMMIGQLMIRTNAGSAAARGELDTFERTVVLARRIGEPNTLYAALANMCLRLMTRAQYTASHVVAAELEELERTATISPELLDYGANARAAQAAYGGRIERSMQGFEQLAALDSLPALAPDLVLPSSLHGPMRRSTVVGAYLGTLMWLRGRGDTGLVVAKRAVETGALLGDPFTFGVAQIALWRLQFARRDPVADLVSTGRRLEATADVGDVVAYETSVIRAWLDSCTAPLTAQAANELVQGIDGRIEAFPLGMSIIGLTMIDALRMSGHSDLAREVTARMRSFVGATSERLFEPQLWIVSGELAADPAEARAHYERAVTSAREIGAVALELRALTRIGEDRAAIAGLLETIREGRDLPDQIEARAVLG